MTARAISRPTATPIALLLAIAVALVPMREGRAQGAAATIPTDSGGPTARDTSGPTIVVLPFDFAAPQPAPRHRPPPRWMAPPPMIGPGGSFGARMSMPAPIVGRGGGAGAADDLTAGVGSGVATMLIERLLAAGGFRVLERQHLDAVLAERARDSAGRGGDRRPTSAAADYVVTGAIVEFGVEERRALGGLGSLRGLGALGFKRPKTKVTVVARVVHAASGEVVLALRGEGVSRKGAGVTLGGIARGAGGIVSVGSGAFRESALGEATDRAVAELAARIAERRTLLGLR